MPQVELPESQIKRHIDRLFKRHLGSIIDAEKGAVERASYRTGGSEGRTEVGTEGGDKHQGVWSTASRRHQQPQDSSVHQLELELGLRHADVLEQPDEGEGADSPAPAQPLQQQQEGRVSQGQAPQLQASRSRRASRSSHGSSSSGSSDGERSSKAGSQTEQEGSEYADSLYLPSITFGKVHPAAGSSVAYSHAEVSNSVSSRFSRFRYPDTHTSRQSNGTLGTTSFGSRPSLQRQQSVGALAAQGLLNSDASKPTPGALLKRVMTLGRGQASGSGSSFGRGQHRAGEGEDDDDDGDPLGIMKKARQQGEGQEQQQEQQGASSGAEPEAEPPRKSAPQAILGKAWSGKLSWPKAASFGRAMSLGRGFQAHGKRSLGSLASNRQRGSGGDSPGSSGHGPASGSSHHQPQHPDRSKHKERSRLSIEIARSSRDGHDMEHAVVEVGGMGWG